MFENGDFNCLDELLRPAKNVLRSGRNIAKDSFEERSKLWDEIESNYAKYKNGSCGEFPQGVDKRVRSEFEYALLTLAWSFFENGEQFEGTKRFKSVELAVFDKIERYDVFDVLDVDDLKRKLVRNDEKTIKKLEEYFVYMRDTLEDILDDPEIDRFIKYYAKERWKSFRKKIDDAISKLITEIDWLSNIIPVWKKRAKEIDPEKLKAEWVREVEEKQKYTVLSKKYEFLGLLGQGSFAKVYRCRRREDGKLVAVKIPEKDCGKSFVDKVANWRKLKHEYIVELYDYDVLPYPHLEMELCDGVLNFNNLSFKDKIKILYKIALALSYAHEMGVVHSDLKPSNVLVKGNTPKLTDWGMGYTVVYAPPEIVSGGMEDFDEVADIWSFGVLAYEVITGTNPFLGEDEIDTMSRIMDFEPDFSKLGSLEPIVKKCLQKERELRYRNMREVIDDLKSLNVSVLSQHLSKSRNRKDLACTPVGGSSYYEKLFKQSRDVREETGGGSLMYGSSVYGVDEYGLKSREGKVQAGWTIYDPVKQDFIFKPRCEAPIREWIESDKERRLSYWLVMCLSNETDRPITRFEIEFETSSTMEVKGVFVDNYIGEIPYHSEKGSEVGWIKHIIQIPEVLGISIPRRGSRRVFVDIHSRICGQRFVIRDGRVRTDEDEFRLNDLDFYYSCEIRNLREPSRSEEERRIKKDFVNAVLDRMDDYYRKAIGVCIRNMLDFTNYGITKVMKYVENIILFKEVAGDTEMFNRFYVRVSKLFADRVGKNLDQLMKVPDEELELSKDALKVLRDILVDTLLHVLY